MHVLHVCPHILGKQRDEWDLKLRFKRKFYRKIILSGFLLNLYALKTSPYTLLLYGKQGTADFGELRHKNPILACGLLASA